MSEQKKISTITIIDTFGFLFRSFYALPPLKSPDGFPTGLLTGFTNFIYTLGREHEASYIVFALDSKGDTFRNELYKEYKANRSEAPDELKMQLPIAIEWVKKMGFTTVEQVGFEADDIIASLARVAVNDGYKVRIVSHDKDLNQLITKDINLFDPIKKTIFTKEDCFEKFGVYPNIFTNYQAIMGDSSDNIPGVKGIGQKGASKLLAIYDDLEDIYANIDLISPDRTKKLLIESRENAFLSRTLATLKDDLYDSFEFNLATFPSTNPILAIEDELVSFGMNQIVEKVKTSGLYIKTKEPQKDENGKYISKDFNAITLDSKEKLFEILNKIQKNDIVAFDTETTGLDVRNDKIVGFSFCFNKTDAYYVPINHTGLMQGKQISSDDAREFLIKLLKHKIVGHNLKFDMHILFYNFGIDKHNIIDDTLVMAWLIDPASQKSLDALSEKFLQHRAIKFKSIVSRGNTFADVDIQNATVYASEDAWVSKRLHNSLSQKLEPAFKQLCIDVEYPFLQTLLLIEQNGIKIDIDFFKEFQILAQEQIKELTQQIHTLCDEVFNINSPKQLGVILFEKLKLTVIKKTKTSYSTDEQSLSEITNEHDVVEKIMQYREIHKMQSTYIEPLIKLGKKSNDNIVFTSFLQTGTASGRLSSNNPNLQNIPVGETLGKKIRSGFIARDGCHLIGIDYSQIELRLLAHFSRDTYLVDAFLNNKDIHLQTAVELFGQEEASEKRNIAKTINFGILYGMGSRKLAKMLDITAKEAKKYISKYFDTFVNVSETIENIKTFMQENGYVETLLKRKRHFDFKNASAFEASNYLRMGVNTVFQGSGGDLIKLAMNKILKKYENKDVKILLQIHDEIIIEAPKEISTIVAKECADIMENILKLNVPLKTSVHIGDNWGELK